MNVVRNPRWKKKSHRMNVARNPRRKKDWWKKTEKSGEKESRAEKTFASPQRHVLGILQPSTSESGIPRRGRLTHPPISSAKEVCHDGWLTAVILEKTEYILLRLFAEGVARNRAYHHALRDVKKPPGRKNWVEKGLMAKISSRLRMYEQLRSDTASYLRHLPVSSSYSSHHDWSTSLTIDIRFDLNSRYQPIFSIRSLKSRPTSDKGTQSTIKTSPFGPSSNSHSRN